MKSKIIYIFHAKPWQHASPGGWHFVTLPNDVSTEIRQALKFEEQGWGRLKAFAKIGDSQWETAIWFDTKWQSYLLPLKADIRKKETVLVGDEIEVSIWV
ncbi:MAG: DUF1905 domain-containing protein [Bacteroidetes bacterium]|nr:DUF1905 domain-containing protein [Bacteroidota bacterium]